MGRNRRKAGTGAVEVKEYDIFGNVIGETSAPAPAAAVAPPPPPPPTPPAGSSSGQSIAIGKAEALQEVADVIVRSGRLGPGVGNVDRKAKKEAAVLLDENGQVVGAFAGTRSRVSIPYNSQTRTAKYLVHNHPDPVTFSPQDLDFMAVRAGMTGMQALIPPFTPKERKFLAEAIPIIRRELKNLIPEQELIRKGINPQVVYDEYLSFLKVLDTAVTQNKALSFTLSLDDLGQRSALSRISGASFDLYRTLFTRASSSIIANWVGLASEAMVMSGQSPLRPSKTGGSPTIDNKSIYKYANFLSNLLGQHIAMATQMRTATGISYGVTVE